jgi:hypothetical protein
MAKSTFGLNSPLTKLGRADSLTLWRFGRVIGDGNGAVRGVQDELIATWRRCRAHRTPVLRPFHQRNPQMRGGVGLKPGTAWSASGKGRSSRAESPIVKGWLTTIGWEVEAEERAP